MLLISRYIRRMPADISCRQFCIGVTKMIRRHYWLRFPVSRMAVRPEERLCASAIIYSRRRREIWLVGDCQCLIGGEYFDNPKPYEARLAELRGERVRALLAEGVDKSELLKSYDPAREVMIPTMLESMQNQNKTYAVIDGFPVAMHRVRMLAVPVARELVLASDGYPKLFRDLASTEAYLERVIREDPLFIRLHPATKGVLAGNVSFDDRTYVRFRVG